MRIQSLVIRCGEHEQEIEVRSVPNHVGTRETHQWRFPDLTWSGPFDSVDLAISDAKSYGRHCAA